MIDQDLGVLRLIAGCEYLHIVCFGTITRIEPVLTFTQTMDPPAALWMRREK